MEEDNDTFPFQQLPEELQYLIFSHLDVRNLTIASRVNHSWHAIIEDQTIWKAMCHRDFAPYIQTSPLPDSECDFGTAQDKSINQEVDLDDDIENLLQNLGEGYQAFFGVLASLRRRRKAALEKAVDQKKEEEARAAENELRLSRERDWKQSYKEWASLTRLSGYWIGGYGSHGDEYVEVTHRGYEVQGLKLTGDPNVPAGKVTFKATLNKQGTKGKGKVHLADTGYRNPRWGLAFIEITDKDHLVEKWFYGPLHYQHFDTTFHRIPEIPTDVWAIINEQQEREKERERKAAEDGKLQILPMDAEPSYPHSESSDSEEDD